MRTLLLIVLFLLSCDADGQIAATVGAGRNQHSANRTPRYHNHPLTPLLFEDFELTVGYDLAGWSEDIAGGGIVNEDYTATVLYGSQSLFIDEANDDPTMTTNSFAASSHVFVAFRFRPTNIPDTADTSFFSLRDASGNCQIRIALNSDGDMRIQFACSGLSPQPATTIAVNTTYNVWLEYHNDNGANSYASLAVSTGSIRPTGGNGFVDATGTSTATQVSMVMLGRPSSENGSEVDFIMDHLLIDDVQIESYP